MVLTRHTLQLKANNHLNVLTHTFNEDSTLNNIIAHMIRKMELVLKLHKFVLGNNDLPKFNKKKHMHYEKQSNCFLVFKLELI